MKTKSLKLTDYELSHLYTLIYSVLDRTEYPERLRNNQNLHTAVSKLNYAMSSQQPYDSE